MTRDEVLAFCFDLPRAEETYPFAHWNTVNLDGSVEDDVVRGLIADSYALVVAGLPRSIPSELAPE
jgi:predicted DNA-binding protein (MmcQ/YjbR family)